MIFSVALVGALGLTYLFISVKDYKLNESKLATVVKKIEFYDDADNLIFEDVTGGKNKYISINKLNKYKLII